MRERGTCLPTSPGGECQVPEGLSSQAGYQLEFWEVPRGKGGEGGGLHLEPEQRRSQ